MLHDLQVPLWTTASSDLAPSLPENSAPGTEFGTVRAVDPEGGEVTYSLTGDTDLLRIRIGSTSGVLSLGGLPSPVDGEPTVPPLDYEEAASMAVQVRARDAGGLTTDLDLTLTVTNVNDVTITDVYVTASGPSGLEPDPTDPFGVVVTALFPTEGGSGVTLVGTNMGFAQARRLADPGYTATVAATYGPTGVEYSATSCVVGTPNTVVTCDTVPGAGFAHVWTLTVDGDSASSGARRTSYALPVITGVTAPALSTAGGEPVVLTGLNFGPLGTAIDAWYGLEPYTAQDCSVTVAHTTITCTSVAGKGSNLHWEVSVALQLSELSGEGLATNYAPPMITGLSLSDAELAADSGAVQHSDGNILIPTNGGTGITVTGENFGTPAQSNAVSEAVVVTYGGLDGQLYTADCEFVVPHTTLECSTQNGVGTSHAWRVSVATVLSDLSTQMTSYLPPSLAQVQSPGPFDTAGGQQVVLEGANFGPLGSTHLGLVTYGVAPAANEYTAAECAVTASDTTISCVTVQGTGRDHMWRLSVGGQETPQLVGNTSYAPPIVSFFEGPGAVDADTVGNETVSIYGRNFGDDIAMVSQVAYEVPDTAMSFEATDCIMAAPHTKITCFTAPGAGAALTWAVTVDGQGSSNPVTNYERPSIAALSAGQLHAMSTDGEQEVVLQGTNFGPPGTPGPFLQWVKYGPTGVEYTAASWQVVDHDRITAVTTPSVGENMVWTVAVGGQVSQPSLVGPASSSDHAPPTLLSVTPATAGTVPTVGATATLVGANFGLLDPAALVEVLWGNPEDGTLRPPLPIKSFTVATLPGLRGEANSSTVVVDLPAGLGKDRAVRVAVTPRYNSGATVGATRVSEPVYFSYAAPDVDFVEVVSAFEQTAEDAAFVASHFAAGDVQDVRRLRIIGSNFGPAPAVYNDTVVRQVLLQPRNSFAQPVGNFSTSNAILYSWSDHEVTAFTLEQYGSVKLRVRSWPFVAGPVYDQTSNEGSFADFTPRIAGLTGSGAQKGFDTAGGGVLIMSVQHLASTQTLSVTVNNVTCPIVTVDGTIVPPDEVRQKVIVDPLNGKAPQVNTTWTVRCMVPAGEGKEQPVIVYRNGIPSLSAAGGGQTINYAPPVVSEVLKPGSTGGSFVGVPTNTLRVGTAGSGVELEGENFGFCPEVQLVDASSGLLVHTLRYCDTQGVDITGSAASPYTTSHSHTKLALTLPPGQGAAWQLSIFVAFQQTERATLFGYNAPVVSTVVLAGGEERAATAGGDVVTITGDNFGFNALIPDQMPNVWFDGGTELGALPCTDVSRDSATWHTQLTCTVPAGGGDDLSAFVRAADQTGSLSAALSYRYPVITGADTAAPAARRRLDGGGRQLALQASGPTLGGTVVTVNGKDLSAGTGPGLCVVITTALGTPPLQTAPGASGRQGPATCAAAAADAHSTVIDASTAGTTFSDTAITFTMPAGMGTRSVSLIAWGLAPAQPVEWAYTAPFAHVLEPNHGGTDGGNVVTLNGTNMGLPSYYPEEMLEVHFGNTVCSTQRTAACENDGVECKCNIVEHQEGLVTFTTPGGIGRGVEVSLVVAELGKSQSYSGVASSASVIFNYDPPKIVYSLPYEANALGQTIDIPGINFGSISDMEQWTEAQRAVSVRVHGVPCSDGKRVPRLGTSVLQCSMGEHTVGFKNLTITVAGQTGHMPVETQAFYTVCKPGYYGRTGEWCLPCSQGSICDGWEAEPRSEPGWWIINATDKSRCHAKRQHRTYCNDVVPCEPKYACVGNNTCAMGYASKPPYFRCSSCDACYKATPESSCQAFYRRAGECVKCPDNPWMLVLGFAVGAIGAAIIGYVLNAKQVNLAFVAIGVDYFQVLAIFANSRVQWPQMMKVREGGGWATLKLLWLLTLCLLACLLFVRICSISSPFSTSTSRSQRQSAPFLTSPTSSSGSLFKRCRLAQLLSLVCCTSPCSFTSVASSAARRTLTATLLPWWACSSQCSVRLLDVCSCLLVFAWVVWRAPLLRPYLPPLALEASPDILYLYLTRTVLDVFDCAPTDPPDGNEYLDVVFEPCWLPGGLQLSLLPWALVAMLGYVVGYPAIVFFILYKNKEKVMEDQLLRAKGLGRDRLTNPNCYAFRKKYHKL